jgi:putative hydrolase of the HAD superfamily
MIKAVLFDWGNTLMIDYPDQKGPMYTWTKINTTKNSKRCLEIVSKNMPCYLATNSDDSNKEDIFKELKIVEIDRYIKDVFCSIEIGFKKPSKEFFKIIIDKLKLYPNEIVFIGDNIEKDVFGAKNVGIIPIHYDPYSTSNFNGLKINNLINLIDILNDIILK